MKILLYELFISIYVTLLNSATDFNIFEGYMLHSRKTLEVYRTCRTEIIKSMTKMTGMLNMTSMWNTKKNQT